MEPIVVATYPQNRFKRVSRPLKPRTQRKPRLVKKTPRKAIKRVHSSKPKSITKLIKEADALFSKQVRVRKSSRLTGTDGYDSGWVNWCFTCNKEYPIKKLHCGHYLSRYYKSARWDFDNARPQCMMCNLWKRGDPIRFRENLVKEIGIERVLAVEAKRNVRVEMSRSYLENLIKELSTIDNSSSLTLNTVDVELKT